jgi:hypothetical protein
VKINVKALLLGLSVGGGCVAHCGSVMLPMLLCEQRRRWSLAAIFLIARLFGYLVFAALSFYGGSLLAKIPFDHSAFEAGVFILLSLFLFRYAWKFREPADCSGGCLGSTPRADFAGFRKGALSYSLQAGLLTGLSLCAPFIAVIAEGVQQESLMQSMGSFLWFYLGTTMVLIPVLAGGMVRRGEIVRQIGFLTGLLAAAIYLLQGVMLIIRGVL